LTFVPPMYVLGVKYLGLNLSRVMPLGSITMPLALITAFGVDSLVTRTPEGKFSRLVLFSGAAALAVVAICVAYGAYKNIRIHYWPAAGMLLTIGLLAAQYKKTRPWLLLAALALTFIVTSLPLLKLRQNPALIAKTSPLVEKIRLNLPPDSRYAAAAPGLSVLPPNINAQVGLASIHSYNSLSPTRYHTLIKALGGEMLTYGRWNSVVAPDYGGAMFWMSNIGVVLAPEKLEHENLEYAGEEAGVHLHRVISRMGNSVQVIPAPDAWDDPRKLTRYTPVKILDEGDRLEFETTPCASSIFILSQKFHRDWQARAFAHDAWQAAETSEINGVFLGVSLPPETERVRLEFKPFARYAWLAHALWSLLLALTLFAALKGVNKRGLTPSKNWK